MRAFKRFLAIALAAVIVAGLWLPVPAEAASKPKINGGLHFYTWDDNTATTCYLYIKKQNVKRFLYRIYDSNGKVKKTAACSGTKYRDPSGKYQLIKIEGLPANSCCSVSVRAKKGGQYSLWSSKFQIIPYHRSTKLKLSKTDVKARISWSAVKGATGYEIYISTKKNSGYTKVYATRNKAVTLTEFKGLPFASGKTYYYKVVAFKRSGGKVYRSSGYKDMTYQGQFKMIYEY